MVDIQPTTQTINDDQELAKVLAGVNQQVDSSMQFEETPAPAAPVAADATDPTVDPAAIAAPVAPSPEPAIPPVPAPVFDPAATFAPVDALSPIKNEAINELRPLVDRLTLPPEEKFDTYLLLLRSTDDKSLIAPAYAAAQSITDEARKAQALLDIIKEIDYLSNPQPPAA